MIQLFFKKNKIRKIKLRTGFSPLSGIHSVEFYIYLSLLGLFLVSLILRVKFILIFATPIFWSIYILIIDTINYNFFRASFLKSNNKELLIIVISSVIIWWIFEWFNIFLSNWAYFNLIFPITVRYLGYFWSFATILLAVLETNDFLMKSGIFKKFRFTKFSLNNLLNKLHLEEKQFLAILFFIGLLMIFLPVIAFSDRFVSYCADTQLFLWLKYILPYESRTFLAGFVWLGFIFLLDPVVYSLRGSSLYARLMTGNLKLLFSLFLSGLICGFFWESINYFALTKWKYFIPILGNIKIFEMPVLGYLGFPVFAVELYVMYNFILIICKKDSYFRY